MLGGVVVLGKDGGLDFRVQTKELPDYLVAVASV
jgi:hypothetical protein